MTSCIIAIFVPISRFRFLILAKNHKKSIKHRYNIKKFKQAYTTARARRSVVLLFRHSWHSFYNFLVFYYFFLFCFFIFFIFLEPEAACNCLKEKAEDGTQHSLPLYKNKLPEDKKVFANECCHFNFEIIIKGRIPKDKEVKIYIVDTRRQSAIVKIERLCNWICEWFFNFVDLQGSE